MFFARRDFAPTTLVLIALGLAAPTAAWAAVVPETGRFDPLVVHDPVSRMGKVAERPAELPDFDAERAGWAAFRQAHGNRWQVWIDRRSATPLLVQGKGIDWFGIGDAARPRTPFELEALARKFIGDNRLLFKVDPSQLVLSREGTGQFDDDHWLLLFNRVVDGIPVEEQRFRLYVNFGNLVAFGADRWGALERAPEPSLDAQQARDALYSYMALTSADLIEEVEVPRLVLIAAPSEDEQSRRYLGAPGGGQRFHLVWRLGVRIVGEPGTWIGKVDAVDGDVLAFYDDDRYQSQVKGGVYPVAPDGFCPDGCEQADWPMPWADVDIDGSSVFTNDSGMFDCSPNGGTATTTLTGQYMNILDRCGNVSENAVCENDIDLGESGGNDCVTPAGASSPGDTHAARTCFYHGNRIKEKARHWLPGNTWLNNRLTCDVNINNNCNAVWSGGEINFYTSGGGCNNTGEIGGVIHHEWGHGMDFNDGGGGDNPSEAYADVAAIIQERRSCVGRGFRPGVQCSGYGDTCLNCTGIRDMDWDMRVAHTPATPTSFVDPNCGGGGGPCGREVHCESYPPSEAIFDLAHRDLPAAGVDPQTSWQITERLFYSSRQGSGGDVYNCAIPNSDGCGPGTWFTQLRTADDDDGDLSNGTPHAAAIFAAFDRHGMACGAASDPDNQSTSSCPTLGTPVLNGTAGSNSVNLSWTDAGAGAAEYNILRTEVSCDEYSFNVVDEVAAPTLNYVDDEVANDLPLHFRVQAEGTNPACTGAVSNCVSVTPQPFAGSIKLDRPVYGCDVLINISVRDANTGSSTVDVTIFSDTEPTPETVTLTETDPGSARFVGSIQGTSGASGNGDGMLALTQGDSIVARYIDADDGMGGSNLTRETTASADCQGPSISNVAESGVTDIQATITWSTNEASTSKVNWGESTPPANVEFDPALTASHSIALTGLQACTVYFYSVESEDEPGNLAVDDNFGSYHSFETLGDFGQGLQPCHDGQLTVQTPTVSCTDSIPVEVIDIDLNVDTFTAETVDVTLTSTSETSPEVLTLTETGPNTSIFTGTITTGPLPVVAGDGVLQAADGDLLTATYHDADNGLGVAESEFDSGVADCAGAGFVSIQTLGITDESADVAWVTDEITTGELQWGLTPALGNSVFSTNGITDHNVTIGPLLECGRVYFRVIATDQYGNVSVSDAGGVPYEFNAYEIPGAIFKDGFESSTGWSLDGEWETDSPQGLGSSPGDPVAAFADSSVLGHDVSGQGANPGNYEPNTTEYATSPVIDASALSNGELKFRRWLNVAPGANSSIEVRTGGSWTAVWTSPTAGVTESDWSLQTLDVSAYSDGNNSFQVRFREFGGFQAGSSDAGWNVDRFILRDGSQPPWGTCGSCGGAPTFGGATSAVDLDPCADTGVRIHWDPVPGWGTGSGGTFAIYRDTVPGFTPGPSNLIASGVSGTSYDDLTGTNDTVHYYIVRAENDETCDIGPNNNGVLDPNTAEVAASDETSQTLPGSLGDTLAVEIVNDAHVRLSWMSVLDAAGYHVYRADDPQGPFTQIGDVPDLFFDDVAEVAVPTSRYYEVRSADACGNEGP